MPNDTFTQQALASDPTFRKRVRSGMSAIAWQVQEEADTVPNHVNRLAYAKMVLRNLDNETGIIIQSFVMRPNVNNFATSYNYDFATQTGAVVTASGDADILSQLNTDWDDMAAAAGFVTIP